MHSPAPLSCAHLSHDEVRLHLTKELAATGVHLRLKALHIDFHDLQCKIMANKVYNRQCRCADATAVGSHGIGVTSLWQPVIASKAAV